MTNRKFLAAAALCVTATVGLTACGGGQSEGIADKAASSSPSPKAPVDPFEGLTADQIADKAFAATKAADSLKVAGEGKDDGKNLSLEFALSKAADCTGKMSYTGSGQSELRVLDKVTYMKGDEAFWKGIAKQKGTSAQQSTAMAEMFKGRWMKIPAGKAKRMAEACDVDALFKKMGEDDLSGVTKGPTTEVNGQKALTLTRKDGAETHTFYVATVGQPYFLKAVTEGGDEPGTLTFSDFNKPVAVTAPPADQIFDVDKVKAARS
ncbi:hypothetical protein OHA61_39360 [Streptomyces sp. NBC_00885]|uniref:hypothetical protein n=1 Tax=Streptomyces sp. NBC_00885 TaxID=2975857 RepID=UPI00386F2B42|nr:hypothetical protein OHA61_39360 [Streptomyces sp. NBC_00885]